MLIVALFIGIVLIVAAIRGTHGELFSALGQDTPAFLIWGGALFAVGALGFIPVIKGPSRALLALVIVVLVLHNYKQILSGFQSAGKSIAPQSTSSKSPVIGTDFAANLAHAMQPNVNGASQ